MGTFIKQKELAEIATGFSVEKVNRRKYATVKLSTEEAANAFAQTVTGNHAKSEANVTGNTVRVLVESRGRPLGSKNKKH